MTLPSATHREVAHIRKKIQHVLSLAPSNDPDARYQVDLKVYWELPAFLIPGENYPFKTIRKLMNASAVEISRQHTKTCEEYVRDTWKETGTDILQAVAYMLDNAQQFCIGDKNSGRYVSLTWINADFESPENPTGAGRTYVAKIIGTAEIVADIAEQLAWLAVAFRDPNTQGDAYFNFEHWQRL